MRDSEGVAFLQWCLPRLHLRWRGYRKVRRQVVKRIDRRLKELGLCGVAEYRSYLETHPDEWPTLDALCWISISRFYRDKAVFQFLQQDVLPQLTQMAVARGESAMRCWSIGCAAGEEPYTLAILWKLGLALRMPELWIFAIDVDPQAIARAQKGCYPAASLKDLPEEWRTKAFDASGTWACLKAEYRDSVKVVAQDIRQNAAQERFHLILCRNVAFTYFDEKFQRQTLHRIVERLLPEGALVIGNTESLPEDVPDLEPWAKRMGVFRKSRSESVSGC
jgi:chemotaxis protein methyltransferase CheR